MRIFSRRYLVRAVALVFLVVVVACESSDKLPPEGSTMTVAANPATIPLAASQDCVNLLGVTNCGTAGIVATVANKLGVPLQAQDVRFSSTAGRLFLGDPASPTDAANIPIRTDKFGNATVSLITSTTATVTAKSGVATGTLTISTVSGNLSSITLNVDVTTAGCHSESLTSCSQTVCYVAKAVDGTGKGLQGIVLNFQLQNNIFNGNELDGTFVDAAVTTDANGQALSEFTPDGGTCPTNCSAAQSKSCQAEAIVTTQGGGFQSNVRTITVQAP
jgi:hypothetical protein